MNWQDKDRLRGVLFVAAVIGSFVAVFVIASCIDA